jgi:hypothetical protein
MTQLDARKRTVPGWRVVSEALFEINSRMTAGTFFLGLNILF